MAKRGAKTANAGIANLNPANRKGKPSPRRILTKSVLEFLGDMDSKYRGEFDMNLQVLAATNPEKFVKLMLEMYKLVIPKQVQSEVTIEGGSEVTAIQINFLSPGTRRPEELEAAKETQKLPVFPPKTFAIEITDDDESDE